MSYVHSSGSIYGRWTSVDRLKTFLHLLEDDAVFGAGGEVMFASVVSRNFGLPIAIKLEGDIFIHKLRNLGLEQCNAAEKFLLGNWSLALLAPRKLGWRGCALCERMFML